MTNFTQKYSKDNFLLATISSQKKTIYYKSKIYNYQPHQEGLEY